MFLSHGGLPQRPEWLLVFRHWNIGGVKRCLIADNELNRFLYLQVAALSFVILFFKLNIRTSSPVTLQLFSFSQEWSTRSSFTGFPVSSSVYLVCFTHSGLTTPNVQGLARVELPEQLFCVTLFLLIKSCIQDLRSVLIIPSRSDVVVHLHYFCLRHNVFPQWWNCILKSFMISFTNISSHLCVQTTQHSEGLSIPWMEDGRFCWTKHIRLCVKKFCWWLICMIYSALR